jgi:hypothetical protein
LQKHEHRARLKAEEMTGNDRTSLGFSSLFLPQIEAPHHAEAQRVQDHKEGNR